MSNGTSSGVKEVIAYVVLRSGKLGNAIVCSFIGKLGQRIVDPFDLLFAAEITDVDDLEISKEFVRCVFDAYGLTIEGKCDTSLWIRGRLDGLW